MLILIKINEKKTYIKNNETGHVLFKMLKNATPVYWDYAKLV